MTRLPHKSDFSEINGFINGNALSHQVLFLSRSGLLIMEGKVHYDIQTEPQSTPFTARTTSSISGIKHILTTECHNANNSFPFDRNKC